MNTNSERPIEKLWPNPDNPRRDIRSDPDFAGLVASIRSQGIIQPLLINDEGMILAGHRRYEAALVIELEIVPVRVLNDESVHDLVPLIENLQRSDLAVLAVAEYLKTCRERFGMTVSEIAEATGISTGTISKYLKLTDAPLEVRERIERDEIPLNAAFELLRHDEEFIREVIKTPRLTRQIVREKAAEKPGLDAPRPVPVAVAPTSSIRAECPREPVAHLQHAIRVVRELLAASPNDTLSARYRKLLATLGDDLHDEEEKLKQEPIFRGAIDALQRQPQKLSQWKVG